MAEEKDKQGISDDDFIIEEDEDFEVVRNEEGIENMEREEEPRIKESIILPEKNVSIEKKQEMPKTEIQKKPVDKKGVDSNKKAERKEATVKKKAKPIKAQEERPTQKPRKAEKKRKVSRIKKRPSKEARKKNKINFILVIKILLIIIAAVLIWKNLFNDNGVINHDNSTQENITTNMQTPTGGEAVTLKILVSKRCKECRDSTNIGNELISNGVNITDQQVIEYESEEGKELVEKYNITKLPTLIFSKEIDSYKDFPKLWEKIGSIEEDGSHVMRVISPPYYDTEQEKVVGLVDLIYLVDDMCKECYDVKIHKNVLNRLGVKVRGEETINISSEEGKSLIDKYNIRYVPTIIISDDVSLYSNFVNIWKTVGSIEDDGYFVFRNFTALPRIIYEDLETGEIITPEKLLGEEEKTTKEERVIGNKTQESAGETVSFNIEAEKYLFSPRTITVKEGDRVKLHLKSKDIEHTFELEEYNISEIIPADDEITVDFVADKKGEFVFRSKTHKAMKGKLIVE